MRTKPRSIAIAIGMKGVLALGLCQLGCATAGPMPGLTGASYTPEKRPGVELGYAAVPGYHLSDSVKEAGQTEPDLRSQASFFFDPGKLLGKAAGFGVGLRWVNDDALFIEPMLRYRAYVDADERIAIGAVAYGTHVKEDHDGIALSMSRFGLELGIDARVTPKNRWAELRFSGGLSLTGLLAEGTYCMNAETGYGRDCDRDTMEAGDTTTDVAGAYPAGFLSVTVELFGDVAFFHGLQLSAYLAGGSMPRVEFGEQKDARTWIGWGLSATVGIGGR